MFGISGSHLIILAIILIVLGPKKLPELAQTLGRAMRNFRDSMAGVEDAKFRRIDDVTPVAPPPVISTADPHAPKKDSGKSEGGESGGPDSQGSGTT